MATEIVYSEDGIIDARVKQKVDTLPNWEDNEITILEGEQAFVVSQDGVPVNFKIGDGTKPFSELPFWLDSGSPFKLRITDDEVVLADGNTFVTHPGLIGFTDYPVATSQLNVLFRDNDLTYNSVLGRVTIHDFELQEGEIIVLSPPSMKWAQSGGTGGSTELAALMERVTKLEAITKVFTVDELSGESLAKVWFTGTIEQLAANYTGWVEDTPWRGRVPLHWQPSKYAIGDTGGEERVGLTEGELPKHHHKLFADQTGNAQIATNITADNAVMKGTTTQGNRDEKYSMLMAGPEATLGKSSEVGDGEAHNNMPPYRVGMWIKYVGA